MTATIAGVLTAVHAVNPPAEEVTPGILGFSVTFALVVAVVLLMRSMVGHLRKVRYSPEPGAEPPAPVARTSDDGPAEGDVRS